MEIEGVLRILEGSGVHGRETRILKGTRRIQRNLRCNKDKYIMRQLEGKQMSLEKIRGHALGCSEGERRFLVQQRGP